MKPYILLYCCCLSFIPTIAQTDTSFVAAEPIGGFQSISKHYLNNLQLTLEEESYLAKEVLYFEYFIDKDGTAQFT